MYSVTFPGNLTQAESALVDASSDEQNTFDERLLRMLSDYIHAGFPDAVVRYTKHEAPRLSK